MATAEDGCLFLAKLIIKTTSAGIKPNLHIKKINFMKEYLDFCYYHATTEGELHHIIPKVILEKRIADQMTVRLSPVDHITAHWLLTLSLIQREKYDIIKKISYSKPFVSKDLMYRSKMMSHIRFAVNETNVWRTLKEVYNTIIIPTCRKSKYPIPSFAQFEFRFLRKILLTENKMYFFNWEIYVK